MKKQEELGEQLRQILMEHGAVLVGYGDVAELTEDDLNTGVSVALPMPKEMVHSIEQDVTEEYRQWYHSANAVLDEAIRAGAAFLRENGWRVREYTTDKVVRLPGNYTELPHKSAAIRAGLGWIGKSCLLVTPEYGSALRLSTMVTDAPLPLAEPILTSRCGGCTKCRDVCPYGAIKGVNWAQGVTRDEMFDQDKCAKGAAARCRQVIGIEMTICGKCFIFCPYTRRYLNR